jgi:NADPH2:quinone reductase
MPLVIRIDAFGGPEVLRPVEIAPTPPAPGEVRVKQTAIGVNFVDVYHRIGLYPNALPMIPGSEGAGVIDAVGTGVTGVKTGDRVVYQGALGAYAGTRVLPAARVVRIPDGIDERTAAAAFLKGVTVFCLLERVFKVGAGHTILVHAAAGGVGLIACQWAAALGATVIGTVGSDDKAALAASHGCAHVINYRREDFAVRVREITGGRGVEAVYDSVGKDTFEGSLDCLKRLGIMVSFGQSSGLPPPFSLSLLQSKGSLYATRPTVAHYLAERADLEAAAARLFDMLAGGTVKIEIGQEFALADAAEAHRALESRATVGATVLIP